MSKVELGNLGDALGSVAAFADTKPPSATPDPPAEPPVGTPTCDTCGEIMTIYNEKWTNRRIRHREWACKNGHTLKESALMP